MFPSLIRRTAQQAKPYSIHLNPYKAQRLWPPDFSKISPKQQFRLERKYKRRAKLKWARPKWVKFTKIAQMSTITVTLFYAVLFMDWSSEASSGHVPFESIRKWVFGLTGSMWTKDQVRRQEKTSNTLPENTTV